MNSNQLLYLIFFISFSALGQKAQIDTFKIKSSNRYAEISEEELKFPLISSGIKVVDSLINYDLKNRFTSNEYPTEPLDSTLIKWAGDGLTYMDFNVTYNDNGLLSFQISAEGCGAYCTFWTEYFNYNTQNGRWLEITDVLDLSKGFYDQVLKDKSQEYLFQKEDLKRDLNDPNSGLDQETYDWILELYLACESNFSLDRFALFSDSIQVINKCWMPHALLPYSPQIELKYPWSEWANSLKVEL
jgi:hypothetical protein